jgi:putative hydrolase of the HAD superfamily
MQEHPVSTQGGNGLPTIQAVILDYGQVLVRSPTAEEFGRMAGVLNMGFEPFYALWEASRDPYDRGDLTAEEYWLSLAKQANTSVERKQIEILRQLEVELWLHSDPGMIDWLGRLHAGGIKTGLLSNMPWDLIKQVRTIPWMEHFTFKTFSAEVRLIKPDPAIFEHTLQGLGVSAAQAVFVDDREPNVRAARALGIHAIQFRSITQLKDDLENLAFPILPATAESLSSRPRS